MENSSNDSMAGIERFIAKNWHWLVIGGVGFFFWGTISSFVVSALEDLLLTGALVVGGITGVAILSSKKFQLLAKAGYEALTGRALDSIIDFMPVQIMDAQIESLQELVQNDISGAIRNFSGFVENARGVIEGRKAEYEKDLKLADAGAKALAGSTEARQRDGSKITQQDVDGLLRKAGHLDEMVKKLSTNLVFFENQLEILNESKRACDSRIDEAKFQRDILVDEFNLAVQGQRTLKTSRKALNITSSPEFLLLEKAGKSIAQKYGNYLGDMKTFVQESQSTFAKYQLEQIADADSGQRLLEEFRNKQKAIDSEIANVNLEDEKSKARQLPSHGDRVSKSDYSSSNRDEAPTKKYSTSTVSKSKFYDDDK